MAGKLSGLALTEDHIKQMTSEELDDCRMELGDMELSQPVLKLIWKNINRKASLLDKLHLIRGFYQAGYLYSAVGFCLSEVLNHFSSHQCLCDHKKLLLSYQYFNLINTDQQNDGFLMAFEFLGKHFNV